MCHKEGFNMKQIVNPYLPLDEYIPDGEPHVFEGRVYIYGSHDSFGEFPFCHKEYVTYSASIDDLRDWRYEGVIYPKRNLDPYSRNGKNDFYAPDVVCGNDGKYYLYYSYAWSSVISVASSSSPKGPFIFLGHVRYPSMEVYGRRKGDPFAFDPGIFRDDDGRIYLYSGFGALTFFPQIPLGHKPNGAYVMELQEDMLTIKGSPKQIFPLPDKKNETERVHGFFEASSMRKINGIYYFIYSSQAGHELCYATSSSPTGPFVYGGVIVSNGDVGIDGRDPKHALYPLGNNHGSILSIGDDHYIFYHRHTNFTNTDRQGLAEKITISKDGQIQQVEKTSMGLNVVPLLGKGSYPSSICSTLIPKEGNVFYPFMRLCWNNSKTYITQRADKDGKKVQFIHNVKDGTVIGYKYFDLRDSSSLTLALIGRFKGEVLLSTSSDFTSSVKAEVSLSGEKASIRLPIQEKGEKCAVYLKFVGKGKLDFESISFE